MKGDTIISSRGFSVTETEFRLKRNGWIVRRIPHYEIEKIVIAKDILIKYRYRTIIFGFVLLIGGILLITLMDNPSFPFSGSSARAYGAVILSIVMLIGMGVFSLYQALWKRPTIRIETSGGEIAKCTLQDLFVTNQYSIMLRFLKQKYPETKLKIDRSVVQTQTNNAQNARAV